MPDIIEAAFHGGKPKHWDALGRWLKTHAQDVNGIKYVVEATHQAVLDGLPFPDSPEEARNIIRKYVSQRLPNR
jgi:hypothetical protein